MFKLLKESKNFQYLEKITAQMVEKSKSPQIPTNV